MPQNDTDGRTRRGYLILIGLTTAALLIFNIDAVYDVAGDRFDLVALLPDASGVRVGTPVRVAGVESGRVVGIDFLAAGDTAEIALRLRVEGDASSVIRQDSDVRALRLRFVGQPIVQIEAGSAAAPPVGPGDTLRARPRIDPALLLERGKDLPAALDSLLRSADRVRTMASARGPALDRLGQRIDAALAAADRLQRDLEGGSLARLLGPGGALDQIAALEERLALVAEEVRAGLARYGAAPAGPDGEDGEAALPRSLAALDARVAELRSDLATLQTRLREGRGILDRLPRDSALQVAIRGVDAQIDSLREEAGAIALRMFLP